MHRRLQFGMRENPASNRRHGSRLAVGSTANEHLIDEYVESPEPSPSNHAAASVGVSMHAASPRAVTGGNKDVAAGGSVTGPNTFESEWSAFEPLIRSLEAARLLGNIHVKTLQRYARHKRVPGYQIGGHWYFRASELDSWLRSRINLSSHRCRSN
jgi:excisionase family DNA binding protein